MRPPVMGQRGGGGGPALTRHDPESRMADATVCSLENVMKSIGLALLACLICGSALADPKVLSVSASAKPNRYDGFCPVRVNFAATIVVDLPTKVTYRWERNDGAVSATETVAISGRSAKIKSYTATTSWELRHTPGQSFRGTQTLHILAPNDMKSNAAEIVLICR
eukprot:gene9717-9781_t